MRSLLAAIVVPVCLAGPARTSAAGDWPEFRGPTSDGHAGAPRLALEWSETKNVVWKTAIPGRAWSTPVVLGGQVWLTTATEDGKRLSFLCLDRERGEILHERVLFEIDSPEPLGNTVNGYGSPSPAIEPGRVFITFGSYGTACLDTATAAVVWQRRDLPCSHFRGPASSAVIFEDLLLLHMDGVDRQYVVALDKQSGATRWRADRSTDYGDLEADGKPRAGGDYRKAYNTPIVVRHAGAPLLLSPAAKAVYGYDPRSGKELWQARFGNHSTASRTVFDGEIAFVNTGYPKPELWAVRAGGSGDVTSTHVAWKYDKGVPNRSSPVLAGGLLFMVSDKGVATCLEAKTGAEVWKERIGGNFSASLLCAAGRIYLVSEEGETTVIRAGREFEVLARNRLETGCLASPAVAGDALLLRTRTHLYRIEEPSR